MLDRKTESSLVKVEQGVALTGRNRTARRAVSAVRPLTCPAAGMPTVHTPGGQAVRTPAALQTTTTDASQQNNIGPLGGPVITLLILMKCYEILQH